MQETDIKKLLIVHKSEMVAYVRRRRQSHPELSQSITNRMIIEALIYIQGYSAAIEKELVRPIIKGDLRDFLLEQGMSYILKQAID
jgi:hypothetical protein